ncbi:MAG: metallophosphoesterase [Magnetococcales bacterium]|nr:metallophosphoesterase [Magnetococcales bacterium]
MIPPPPSRRTKRWLVQLKRLWNPERKPPLFNPAKESQLHDQGLRLLNKHLPVEIALGQPPKALHILQERRLCTNVPTGTLLIVDPLDHYTQMGGQLKVAPGESVHLGRFSALQQEIFSYSENVANQHLVLTNNRNHILIQDLTNTGTTVAALDEATTVEYLRRRELANLLEVRRIFGGPLGILPPREAFDTLEKAVHLLEQEAYRPPNSASQPGGLLLLPDHLTPVLVGDLHAQLDNLLKVLSQGTLLRDLKNNTAALVILGDAIHFESEMRLSEMGPSLLMTDLIARLKIQFPRNVFYLRGNHDSFSPELHKGGMPQGFLWERHVVAERGQAYRDLLERFYQKLPYVIQSRYFIASHAAPPLSRTPFEEIVDIVNHPTLMHELTWGRVIRPNNPVGYTKNEVKSFRKEMCISQELPFFVSHFPLSEDKTYWQDIMGIKNHHIVFSGKTHSCAIVTLTGGKMRPCILATEPLLDFLNALPG